MQAEGQHVSVDEESVASLTARLHQLQTQVTALTAGQAAVRLAAVNVVLSVHPRLCLHCKDAVHVTTHITCHSCHSQW